MHCCLLPASALLAAGCIASLAGAQATGATRSPAAFVAPQWAFPTSPAPNPPPTFDSVTLHRIPGSARRFTMAQAKDMFAVPDWFPGSHPPMPLPVRKGRAPEPRACGFCHLPDGRGRPENATLAGLPVEYFRAQVKAFADQSRLTANPSGRTNNMHLVAAKATDAEITLAARYFSARSYTRQNRVLEVAEVPRTRVAVNLYVLEGTGTEPIAGRLIEVPEDFERHELRDPNLQYITYVPVGSIARGRRIATDGPGGPATACATCHGPQLEGVGIVPPIRGRSPSYILRQLLNVKAGARHDAGVAPMVPVVATMGTDDMVAVASYVGSLPPRRRAR